MRREDKNGSALILAIVCVVVIVAIFGIAYRKQTSSVSTPSELQNNTELVTFKSSDVMDFSINIPSKYFIDEKPTIVRIKTTNKGDINITKNGTEFDSLALHIKELVRLNNLEVVESKEVVINSYQAVIQKYKYIDQSDIYLSYDILVGSQVYSMTTLDLSLSADLDQIARSFKYTPN